MTYQIKVDGKVLAEYESCTAAFLWVFTHQDLIGEDYTVEQCGDVADLPVAPRQSAPEKP